MGSTPRWKKKRRPESSLPLVSTSMDNPMASPRDSVISSEKQSPCLKWSARWLASSERSSRASSCCYELCSNGALVIGLTHVQDTVSETNRLPMYHTGEEALKK